MKISKVIEFDMGHRVPSHNGKCRNLHGHRYKVEVVVDGIVIKTKGSSDEGMVIDFGDLKRIMMEQIDEPLDHGLMLSNEDPVLPLLMSSKASDWMKIIPVSCIPTAENIAMLIFEKLEPELLQAGIKLEAVNIWETPTSCAYYGGER